VTQIGRCIWTGEAVDRKHVVVVGGRFIGKGARASWNRHWILNRSTKE